MHVVQVTRFGGPEVLVATEESDPVPGPGQVVIDVSAADVLFLDTVIRSGRARDFFPQRPPYVPGNGVAGGVVTVGAGVDAGWIDRRVIAHTGGRGDAGGYAERAVAQAEGLVAIPHDLGSNEAVQRQTGVE
jgi:NADPH2:quinone reductase